MCTTRCVFLIFIVAIASVKAQIGDGSVISLTDGQVQVQKINGFMDANFYGVGGIPFGAPPVNDLRFQPPQKNSPWTGIRKNDFTISCVQPDGSGQEDCLVINVYSKNFNIQNQAVMVWIYGGAFATGSGSFTKFNPSFFMRQENLILVTVNYRVGAFGFLSTEDDVLPGNMGLKDQILGLKWVQNNIGMFNGDPNNVTIFGESAGAASVSFLTISPQAQGLFKGAIMQSGTALCTWARYINARNNAFRLGNALGIITLNNSQTLLDQLKTKSAADIAKVYTYYRYFWLALGQPLWGINFAPTIEKESATSVLTQKSFEVLKSGQYNIVPTIIGRTADEAALATSPSLSIILNAVLTKYNADYTSVVPLGLNMPYSLDKIALGKNIQDTYYGPLPMALGNGQQTADFVGDMMFNRPIAFTQGAMSQHAPVYSYIFNHRGSNMTYSYPEGTGHADELNFEFANTDVTYNDDDMFVVNSLITFWTNFARTGNPTPFIDPNLQNIEWVASTVANDMSYIWIDSQLQIRSGYSFDREQYNIDLFVEHGIPPFDIM